MNISQPFNIPGTHRDINK